MPLRTSMTSRTVIGSMSVLLSAIAVILADENPSVGQANVQPNSGQTAKSAAASSDDQIEQTNRRITKTAIRGECVDDESKPLPQTRIQVYRYASQTAVPELLADVMADKDGKFSLAEIESTVDRSTARRNDGVTVLGRIGVPDVIIVATSEGRSSRTQWIDVLEDDVDVTLELLPNPQALSGIVLDWDGNPVEGATINMLLLHDHPIPGFHTALTDKQGRFTVSGLREFHEDPDDNRVRRPNGGRWFTVQHPDFPNTRVSHSAIPQTVNALLKPYAIVEGTVTDSVTNLPAADVMVSAQGVARFGGAKTRTDAKGQYRLRLKKDHYNIWADADDRIVTAAKAIDALPGKTKNVDIKLIRGIIIAGRLINSKTNEPICPEPKRPLTVAHYGPARPKTGTAVSSTPVNLDGTFRLRVAPGLNCIYLMQGDLKMVIDTNDLEDGAEGNADLDSASSSQRLFGFEEFDADENLCRELRSRAEQEDQDDAKRLEQLLNRAKKNAKPKP